MINKIIVQYRSFPFYPRSLRGICKTHFTCTFTGITCYKDYSLVLEKNKKHSTETVLIRLLDQLLFDIDSNNMSGLVMIIVTPLT